MVASFWPNRCLGQLSLDYKSKFNMRSVWQCLIMSVGLILFSVNSFAEEKPAIEKSIVSLNPASLQAAGIVVTALQPTASANAITVPSEVIPNAQLTSKITTRIPAQVVRREVEEGQHVEIGRVLVTLSSVDMAKTQGDLLLAAQEWQRVKSLGKDAVSGKRFSQAQVDYQRAYSTALAYGMTETEVKELLTTQKPSIARGEFNLLAPRKGTVFSIDFTEGELVEPGKVLLQVVNESTVWIDAKLPPHLISTVKVGDAAIIKIDNRTLPGKVIQVFHQLDEATRTRSVRIEVNNQEDFLHPGQFVTSEIKNGHTAAVLAVPADSIFKTQDGDWVIYVEKQPQKFQAVEVKLIQTINNQAIIEGIPTGTRVVTKGAFFVHAELNKSGSDAHGH